jgi:hypothetical protein
VDSTTETSSVVDVLDGIVVGIVGGSVVMGVGMDELVELVGAEVVVVTLTVPPHPAITTLQIVKVNSVQRVSRIGLQ